MILAPNIYIYIFLNFASLPQIKSSSSTPAATYSQYCSHMSKKGMNTWAIVIAHLSLKIQMP